MNNLILFLALAFTYQSVHSQLKDSLTVQSKQEMYNFYISKSKKQKKTAWILLGSGVVAMGVGSVIAYNSEAFTNKADAGIVLALAGTLTTVSSIPVFIVSGSNKRKAEKIRGSAEVAIGASAFNDRRFASVGVRISF